MCCPKAYDEEWVAHIPAEALDYNYGCGSPILRAGIRPGEVVLDLGSGVGIDCFVAAKLVGSQGKVIGVDMTDEMLERARRYQCEVAANLDYDVVEFMRGTIEVLPVPDRSVDVVVSNCVLNLSPRIGAVLREIHRVLKDGGRTLIADIVSDREVDEESRNDPELWTECLSGARTAAEFIRAFGDAGLVAITQVDEQPWNEVNGCRFASITISAHRFEGGGDCCYEGHLAVYLGPYASVQDEEGHVFPRFSPVKVCTDTAARLRSGPYAGAFAVVDPTEASSEPQGSCCEEGSAEDIGGCCQQAGSECCGSESGRKTN